MDYARAILTPEQQNIERRLRDCDGCHDPKHRPVYRMLVDIGSAHGGGISQSVFLICESCARKPIHFYLHGKGRCAPDIRPVDDAHTLGKDDLDRPVSDEGTTIIDDGVVEPPVEVIDWGDKEPPPPPKPTRRKRRR